MAGIANFVKLGVETEGGVDAVDLLIVGSCA
jgi:hypothetical protein